MGRSISFTILFFVMLSVLVSCHQSHKRELDLAYTLAESKPDSALAFLNRINQGKLSDKDMAKYAFSSFHTVNTHRKNIFRKLGVNNVHEATKYALRAGLVDSAEYYI